jgi:hypothetical protein
MKQSHVLLGTGLCGLAMIASSCPAAAQWFSRISFDNTDGRVGYHMTVPNGGYNDDVPPQCNHKIANVRAASTVEGDLPPGLTFNTDRAAFEGTPKQPGDWDLTVVMHNIHCQGSDIDFGEHRIPVHFHIDP